MTRKWTRISKRMLFAYFMLGGLIFLFTPARVTSRLQLVYANVFRVPLSAGRTVTLASTPPETDADVLARNTELLRNDIANLQVMLREIRAENKQLRGLRESLKSDRIGLLVAGVTVVNPAQTELIINRGQEDDVVVGQFVVALSDRSLVGQVSQVLPHAAMVQLISNPASKIPVEIGLSGIHGLMEGRGGGIAKIPLVSTRRAVAPQDPVYVRRQAHLDVPVIAGRVTECGKDPDNPLLRDITVRATCDIATLQEVAVIVPGR
jgi:hypothetical protein